MSSKSEIAAHYAQRVLGWITERDELCDYGKYEYRGKLNRRTLSAELGFGRSVVDQNPAVRRALIEAEQRWFSNSKTKVPSTVPTGLRMIPESKLKTVERQNAKLEKENASLRAANAGFRSEKLRSNAIEELIAKGGRYQPVSSEMIARSLKH